MCAAEYMPRRFKPPNAATLVISIGGAAERWAIIRSFGLSVDAGA